MTIEQLVTGLATSQQLKAAGFPQDTAMVWVKLFQEPWLALEVEQVLERKEVHTDYILCAAPTVGELEEWLAVRGFSLETWYGTDSLYHIEQRGYVCRGDKPLAVKDAAHVAALAALVLDVAG